MELSQVPVQHLETLRGQLEEVKKLLFEKLKLTVSLRF